MVKRSIAFAVTAMALLGVASPAAAHVTANPNTAPPSGFFTTFFRVGHGCDSDAPNTTSVSIQIPDGVLSATPEDEPGWNAEVVMGPLDEPYDNHGETVTEGPKEVTFTADGAALDTHRFREFGLSLRIAGEPGDVLYFPTVQTCEEGANRWVNIPATVEAWGDTEDPAPYLQLAAADTSEDDSPEAPSDTDGSGDAEDDRDPLTYVALALGALGLLAGAGAFMKKSS